MNSALSFTVGTSFFALLEIGNVQSFKSCLSWFLFASTLSVRLPCLPGGLAPSSLPGSSYYPEPAHPNAFRL